MSSPQPAPHIATVLAVDDNAIHCYALARSLEARGFHVLQAHTGTDTLRMAAEHPDIILLDLNLPDMDGFEVMRRLKADSATAAIPIVVITATWATSDSHMRATTLGAGAFLTYPVDTDQLCSIVRGVLLRASRAEL